MPARSKSALLGAFLSIGVALAPTLRAQTLDKKVLSFSAARKIAAAAQEAARAKGVEVVIVVVDDAGYILLLERMDGAQVASVNVGIGKARTAELVTREDEALLFETRDRERWDAWVHRSYVAK